MDIESSYTTDQSVHNSEEGSLRAAAPWLTGEVAVYIVLGLIALALRLMSLGVRPMDMAEASQALAAWQLVSGQPVQVVSYSPLLLAGNAVTFTLFGASDFSARLTPAFFGMLLVFVPVLFRRWLGKWGALLATFFLAISPTAVYYSRHLSGEVAVLACALLLLVALMRFLETHDTRALRAGAIFLALLLTSGPGAYAFLLAGLTFGLVLAFSVRMGSAIADWRLFSDAWKAIREQTGLSGQLFLLFVVTILLIGTCFLTYFPGFQAVIDQFSAWTAQIGPAGSGTAWYHHIILTLLYEFLILVFALAGIVLAFMRKSLISSFLIYWALVVLYAYTLFGGKSSGDLLLVLVPLALLAGLAAGKLVEGIIKLGMWEVEGLFLAILSPIIVYVFLQVSGFGQTGQLPYLWLLGVGVLLVLGLLVGYIFWTGPQTTLRSLGLVALVFLGLATWGTTWRLNYIYGADSRELMVIHPTDTAVRDLIDLLEELSLWRSGDKHELPIGVVAMEDHVLRWYVRDFADVRYADDVGDNPDRAIYIAPASFSASSLENLYRGEPFALRSGRFEPILQNTSFIKWWLYREAPRPESQYVVLWAKGGGGLGTALVR